MSRRPRTLLALCRSGPNAPLAPRALSLTALMEPPMFASVVHGASTGRRLSLLRWGLIPAWTKDPQIGHKLINVRAETAAVKPAVPGGVLETAVSRPGGRVLRDGGPRVRPASPGSSPGATAHR